MGEIKEGRFRYPCPGFGPTLGKCKETVQPFTTYCPDCQERYEESQKAFLDVTGLDGDRRRSKKGS